MDFIEGAMTLSGCIEKLAKDLHTKVRLANDMAHGLAYIRECLPGNEFTGWDFKPASTWIEYLEVFAC